MRIVLLENDHHQAEQIERDIRASFPQTDVAIERIATECAFRQRLEEIAQKPPDVVILDVMVRWADSQPNIPEVPLEVATEGHYRAGLRCARLLSKRSPGIPIILYSVLEKTDLQQDLASLTPNVTYIPKQAVELLLNQKLHQLLRKEEGA